MAFSLPCIHILLMFSDIYCLMFDGFIKIPKTKRKTHLKIGELVKKKT